MPAPRKKLHELAGVVPEETILKDTRKQRFVIEKEFARGGFGRIYSGKQEESEEYGKTGSLAIKIEPYANGPLFTEITVFQRILMPEKLTEWIERKQVSHLGLPPYVSSGLFTYNSEKLRYLIMPRYEKSLETYRVANGGVLDMHTVLTVAKQCADCLSYMQDHDYVHGDLKAENILLASANAFSKCFLVDFGLAKMARGNIDKPDKKRAHNGTLLFTSLDAHRGCAPSFRGDLEILGYNILYWLCGTLPWQKFGQKPEAVMAEKEKFAKELDKGIKKLVHDGCVPLLSRLFKLAYETPYLSKVDYEVVQSILGQIKAPRVSKSLKSKSVSEKENVKISRTKERADSTSSSASTSRKRKVMKDDFPIVLTDEEQLLQSANNDMASASSRPVRTKTAKIKPTGNSTPVSSPKSKSSSDKSHGNSPEAKRRKSDRIAAAQLSKEMDNSSSVNGEKSPEVGSSKHPEAGNKKSLRNDSRKRKLDGVGLKKKLGKLKQKSRTDPAKSIAKHDIPLQAQPSSSKSNKTDDSPGKKLRNVIPGVRNMKNVRRSLKDSLVKKYIDVANQAQRKK